jgi:acyl carrier protein
MNSRTLEFADEIIRLTNGSGVDVVLNSLSGEFIRASMRALGASGRFVEVGKRDILTPAEASRLRPDVSYFPFDLGGEAEADPTLIPTMLRDMLTLLDQGSIDVLPIECIGFENAASAFRKMMQAKHIGKIILTHTAAPDNPIVRSDGSYIITGGLGALGLQAARWLVKRGAGSITLLSRRPHSEAEQILNELKSSSTAVHVEYIDCVECEKVDALVAAIPASCPLRGIIHCAGTVEDATLLGQSVASFRRVADPKVCGAYSLHKATKTLPLDFFVAFSSASSLLGSAAQANYAVANAMMDALIASRREQGLPGLSVHWGPWKDGGMAANVQARRRLAGIREITSEEAFDILELLLQADVQQPLVIPTQSWLKSRSSDSSDPFFAEISSNNAIIARAAAPSSFADFLAKEPELIRHRLLVEHLHDRLGPILGLTPSQRIDQNTPLFERGLDSLMAVEFRNVLVKSLGREASPTLALDYPTLSDIADHLLSQWFEVAGADGPDRTSPAVASIAELSEEDAEAMLALELQGHAT